MRNLIVGVIVGLVIGVVVGTTVIAPRLKLPGAKPGEASLRYQVTPRQPELSRKVAKAATSAKKSTATAPSVRWRLASAHASDLPLLGSLGKRLEAAVRRMSEGRMEVKFHEPGTLVKTSEMFEAVRAGAIDAGFAAPTLWAKKNPALALFAGIPFGPPVQEYLAWVFVGGGRQILERIHTKLGVHPLICGALAPEGSGWFRHPVTSLKAFKNLRLGMTGLGGRVAAKLGAQITELTEGDVFVALESGLIDGAEASQPSVDLKLGLHKLAKHYYFPGWHQPAGLLTLIVNLDAWKALSVAQRAQLEAACGDNVRHGIAESEARQFEALKQLVNQGVEIEIWPPEILNAMRKAWRKVVVEQSKTSKHFREAWDSLAAFREDYEIWREIGIGSTAVR